MLEYTDFYDIATYGNEHWKGSFTPREVAENAYIYKCEYDMSIANGKMTNPILTLFQLLKTDRSYEIEDDNLEYWIDCLASIREE